VRPIASVLLVPVALIGAGCAGIGAAERSEHAAKQRVQVPPVQGSEWKAVFNDYYDGRLDGQHRCAAVRLAITHISDAEVPYSTIYEELRSLERRSC